MREFWFKHKRRFNVLMLVLVCLILLLSLYSCTRPQGERDLGAYVSGVNVKAQKVALVQSNLDGILIDLSFECDEDTIEVLRAFARTFIELSEEYAGYRYLGEETFADQAYFDLKFATTKDYGMELNVLADTLEAQDHEAVLQIFDRLLGILETLEKQGESIHEIKI